MKVLKQGDWGSEIAGSFGDLGTFLPYVIGAITFAGLDTTSVFVMFGLMYLFTACFYRLPVPVQPMKVIGAAIIVQNLTAGEIAAAGILMGIILLFLSITGLIDRLAQITPAIISLSIQAGLGLSLAILGLKMVRSDLVLGLVVLVTMLFLLNSRRFPAAIVALFGGTALAFVIHPELTFPVIRWGVSFPHLIIPSWHDYYRGFLQGCLPQIPLTLTNSILVTAVVARQLFPNSSDRVNDRNLCLTLGIGNLIGAPLGVLPLCHGSGGLAAHYRFGARTGYSIAFIGLLLLLIGIFWGSSGLKLMQIIPQAVLGGMLFYSGIDLVRPIQVKNKNEIFIFAVVVSLSVALNPAVGFFVGLPLALILNRKWLTV